MNYKDMTKGQQDSICWTSLAVQDIYTGKFFVTTQDTMSNGFIYCVDLESLTCPTCGQYAPGKKVYALKSKDHLNILEFYHEARLKGYK